MTSAEVLSAHPAAFVASSETVKVESFVDSVAKTCIGLFSTDDVPSPKVHAVLPVAFTELLVKLTSRGVQAASGASKAAVTLG